MTATSRYPAWPQPDPPPAPPARGVLGLACAALVQVARPFKSVYRGVASIVGVLPGIRADLRTVADSLESVRAELVAIERRVATMAPDTASMSRDVAKLPDAIGALDARLESVEQDLGKVASLIPKFSRRAARRAALEAADEPGAGLRSPA